MKIVINKLVGDLGEQWAVEIPVGNEVLKSKDPVAGIMAAAAPALRVVDDRLLDLNLRLLAHNKAAQELDGAGLLAVRQCIEIMYGRRGNDGPQGTGVQGVVLPPKSEPSDDVQAKVLAAGDALATALEAGDHGGR